MNLHRTTEVFFVGYPKTGNTWVRYLVGQYLKLSSGSDRLHLFDGWDRFGRCERAALGPSMHFTHAPLEWNTQTAENLHYGNVVRPFSSKRVVLLARHPLDTLVSAWFQAKLRAEPRYESGLDMFVRDPVHGLAKLLCFYNLWARHRLQTKGTLLLRYEDLRADTEAQVRVLLSFLDIPLDDPALHEAVNMSSFESMRDLESGGTDLRYTSSGLGIFATGDRSNPEAFHVRRGKVGGYRDYLDEIACRYYEPEIARSLDGWYGYHGLPMTSSGFGS